MDHGALSYAGVEYHILWLFIMRNRGLVARISRSLHRLFISLAWGSLGRCCHATILITPLFFSLTRRKFINTLHHRIDSSSISTFAESSRENIMAQISVNVGDRNVQSGNITGSFNNNFYKFDEDAQIIRWLSPLEPNHRHQSVRTERFDGIGDWVLETKEFREWKGSSDGVDKAVLFCSGNPGVGKTYLR